jgi:hypothetical protein
VPQLLTVKSEGMLHWHASHSKDFASGTLRSVSSATLRKHPGCHLALLVAAATQAGCYCQCPCCHPALPDCYHPALAVAIRLLLSAYHPGLAAATLPASSCHPAS